MTVTAPSGVTRAELAPRHAEIVRATLPLIGERIEDITREFYRRMFAAHPELIRNLFNRGNQAQGAQQRALAASIATFATHLVDPALPHPAEMLSRIAHKHVSLGVTADQYRIVYEHLFAAIAAVLGPDTVTPEVAEAWDRVYWIMADVLIDLERSLYDEAGLAAGDVFRRARVTERVDDPSGAVLLTVHPLGADFSNFRPGQYISVGVTLPDGARQLRQYSLVGAPGSAELSFAVRPAGEVSNWIAEHVRVGDLVDVTAPFGDLPTPTAGAPLVLVSAGIGVTPMLGILAHLAETAPATPVRGAARRPRRAVPPAAGPPARPVGAAAQRHPGPLVRGPHRRRRGAGRAAGPRRRRPARRRRGVPVRRNGFRAGGARRAARARGARRARALRAVHPQRLAGLSPVPAPASRGGGVRAGRAGPRRRRP